MNHCGSKPTLGVVPDDLDEQFGDTSDYGV